MKRSNPVALSGGRDMKRATWSVARCLKSIGASDNRGSRKTTLSMASTGSPALQSMAAGWGGGGTIVRGLIAAASDAGVADCGDGFPADIAFAFLSNPRLSTVADPGLA